MRRLSGHDVSPRAIAWICKPCFSQLPESLFIHIAPLALQISRCSLCRLFHLHPNQARAREGHPLSAGIFHTRTARVEILDPQYPSAARLLGRKPRNQSGENISKVHSPEGRGRSAPSSHSLHLFCGERNLLSEASRSGFGYEIILLIAEPAEVFPFLNLVIVDEILKLVLSAPEVDKFGYEIDARSIVCTNPGSSGRASRDDLRPNCVLLGCPSYPTHTSPRFSMSCTSRPIMWPVPQG